MKIIQTLALISICILANGQNQTPQFKMSNAFPLEGNGSWDLLTVDEPNNRLFVSHATMVQVLDLKSGKQIGVIENTKGVHGIALASDFNKGFISNGKDSSVTVFDLVSLKTLTKVKVTGAKPDAILYDRFSKNIFVFNAKSNNATIIDAKTNGVVASVALEGKPELSVSDEKGNIYVNLENKNAVAVINALTYKVDHVWPLSPGEEPTGLAIDHKTKRLFSVCGNKLMIVMDAKNGKIISNVTIGDHCDGVVFDPVKNLIFTSNGEGSVTVIKLENENSFKVIETVQTQKGAKTLAINTLSNSLYLPVAELGSTPEATKEEPKPKPNIQPGTFKIIEITPIR